MGKGGVDQSQRSLTQKRVLEQLRGTTETQYCENILLPLGRSLGEVRKPFRKLVKNVLGGTKLRGIDESHSGTSLL